MTLVLSRVKVSKTGLCLQWRIITEKTFTRQSLQFLLVIVLFFITVNFFTLSVFERRLVTFALLKDEQKACKEPTISTSPRVEKKVEEELRQQQVISMERDVVVVLVVVILITLVIVVVVTFVIAIVTVRCLSK